MKGENRLLPSISPRELCGIVKERLSGTNAELTSFLFHYGGNVYVFSYEKEGKRRHTLVDAGDPRYRNQMLPILIENDVNPANIERIIITHGHHDHWGLAALLSEGNEAKILAHANFRGFVEGDIKPDTPRWLGYSSPTELKGCNFEYLAQPSKSAVRNIGGTDFPILGEHIGIGEGSKLMLLGCPETSLSHSSDQVMVLYSARGGSDTKDWRPSDEMLFSGDFWLMRGPMFYRGVRNLSWWFRQRLYRVKNFVSGKNMPRRDPREQDTKAKEAVKKGFQLIRVKPAHGEEFIGSTIIPNGLPADRDLLIQLGYSMNENPSVLGQMSLAPKIAALKEQAYTNFVKELLSWREFGYTLSEMAALLVRIYKEQSGGDPLAKKDRAERREMLKATLIRLRGDKAESEELHQLAESTLSGLQRVS